MILSVIVPVYKVEKFLPSCIDSIISQTFTDFELLLIDDGSPDRSGAICDEYAVKDSRIRTFHKQNAGVSSARNFGIRKARGKWIIFIDSDDFISSTYFENLLKPILKDHSLKFVHGGCLNYSANGKVTVNQNYEDKYSNDNSYLLNNLRGIVPSKLFLRDILIEHNIFFDEKIKIAEDMVFTFDYILFVDNYAFIKEKGYYYRHHNESVTNSRKIQDYCTLLNGYKHLYTSIISYKVQKKLNNNDLHCRYEQLADSLFVTILSLYKNNMSRNLRLYHLNSDIGTDELLIMKYNTLKGYKCLLAKLLQYECFNLFDIITNISIKIHQLIKKYLNKCI